MTGEITPDEDDNRASQADINAEAVRRGKMADNLEKDDMFKQEGKKID